MTVELLLLSFSFSHDLETMRRGNERKRGRGERRGFESKLTVAHAGSHVVRFCEDKIIRPLREIPQIEGNVVLKTRV
jgi:hypothetical protein